MRVQSAADAKGWTRHSCHAIPQKGTKIRALYDILEQNKGKTLDFAMTPGNSSQIAQLRDVYGLDIINIRRGQWVLAGEWFGPQYRDYIADQINGAAQ